MPDEVVERLERLAAKAATSVSTIAVRELAQVSLRADNPALLGELPDLGVEGATILGALGAERPLQWPWPTPPRPSQPSSTPARRALAAEQIHAPHIIDVEVANALRRLAASGVIGTESAAHALATWQRLGIVRHPVVGMLGRVWALRNALTAYDACYVALAEALGCGVLTADARLSRAHGVCCSVTVVPQ